MKFLVPSLALACHGVQDAKHLVRAGGEDDLLRVSGGKQAVVKRLDDRVVAHRAEHRHVQCAAHNTSAAEDVPFAAFLAGVAVRTAPTRLARRGARPTTPVCPRDAEWGERYFHIADPDGHELSFAKPLAR